MLAFALAHRSLTLATHYAGLVASAFDEQGELLRKRAHPLNRWRCSATAHREFACEREPLPLHTRSMVSFDTRCQ